MQKAPHAHCEACPLRDSAFVPSDPLQPDANWWIVGESPGNNEVANAAKGMEKAGFTGASGDLLWAVLEQVGVTRDRCNVTNACLCIPPQEDKGEIMEAAALCCKDRLVAEIEQTRTDKILALGKVARETLLGPEEDASITTLHGRWTGITLNQHLPVRATLAAYHPAFVWRAPDEARSMFDDIEKFAKTDFLGTPIKPYYEVITSRQRLAEVLRELAMCPTVTFDIETQNVDWVNDNVMMLGLRGADKNYIVPGRHPQSPVELLYSTRDMPEWKTFWNSPVPTFVGHNAKFDIRFLRAQLLHDASVDFDTMLAHYVLDERPGTHDLKGLAAQELDVPDYEVGLKEYLRSKNDRYDKVPWDVLTQYLAWDIWCTEQLSIRFGAKLISADQFHMPFMELYMALDRVLVEAELRGFHVDTTYLSAQSALFVSELESIAKVLLRESKGVVVNPRSTQQMAIFLYDQLKLPMPRGNKIKPRSTNHDALEQLRGKHPIIDVILKYRKIEKLRSSYIDNVLDMLDEEDNVHCDFKQHGAETGRISVERPALQTLPRPYEGPYSKVIRDSYVARSGYQLVICDYSQAELRIAAAESGEPFLIDVYNHDRDLHGEVARAMYGDGYTKEDRFHTKMFNFSYLYGGSEYSFALDAGLPIAIAKQFVRDYDRLMPQLAKWKEASWQEMKTNGFVRYRTGFMRRIPFIAQANRDDARKASFNSKAQGQASHMTSLSAVAVAHGFKQKGWDAHVLLLVHDSIIAEVPTALVESAAAFMAETMEQTATKWFPEVKWKAEAEAGERWGSAKAVH